MGMRVGINVSWWRDGMRMGMSMGVRIRVRVNIDVRMGIKVSLKMRVGMGKRWICKGGVMMGPGTIITV